MIKFLAGIPLLVGAGFAIAWFLMIGVGVAHAEWLPGLPTIGYPAALLLAAIAMAYRLTVAIIGAFIKELGK